MLASRRWNCVQHQYLIRTWVFEVIFAFSRRIEALTLFVSLVFWQCLWRWG